jgi:ABC-type transport system involved in cytochrome bd biosynthesis fused ATPase/permease subunit
VLSLGEIHRFGLARAWLMPKPVIILDEPTEHLGRPMAERIMTRLLVRHSDRLVDISSHHAAELSCFADCAVVTLDRPGGGSAVRSATPSGQDASARSIPSDQA